jgi:hypothetical protein
MNWNARKKLGVVLVAVLMVSTLAVPQLREILKVGGVIAVVNTFGKDIDKQFNRLWKRSETSRVQTKVVPILSVGNRGNAIGIAQVMGPKADVNKVVAVAQPEFRMFGELRLRALIPVSSKNVVENIRVVENVGVSGIIDIRL